MVAGLLRHQIRCIVFGRGALENAELATVQTVAIGLLGAKAVEAQVLVLLGKCPFQSECRQRRCIGGTGISGGQMYTSTGGIHLIAHGNLGFARFGQRICVFGDDTSLGLRELLIRHMCITAGTEPADAVESVPAEDGATD